MLFSRNPHHTRCVGARRAAAKRRAKWRAAAERAREASVRDVRSDHNRAVWSCRITHASRRSACGPCRAITQAGAAQGTLVFVSNLLAPFGRQCLSSSSTIRALFRANSTTERVLDIRQSRLAGHPLHSDAARTLSETPCRCSTIVHSRASSMPWCRLRASQRRSASRIALARRIVAVASAT